jgi:hypothetical protein
VRSTWAKAGDAHNATTTSTTSKLGLERIATLAPETLYLAPET